MKKILSIILVLCMAISMGLTSFAAEPTSIYVNEDEIEIVPYDALVEDLPSIERRFPINDYEYIKTDVTTSYEWSPYKRVSDNIVTDEEGGSITATKSVEFSTIISGNIQNISVDVGGAISSSIGYTLNVGPNKRVYLGYHVRYKVESGTRVCRDRYTGRVISSNEYTVKVPQYEEYKLINY